jgi:glycerol kinase
LKKKYICALDQGTTSSRAILFDHQGNICSIAQKEVTGSYPKPGWVEHDPREIWSSILSVTMECMARIGAEPWEISAIGITNQRETTICWNRLTGEPIYPAIVWQCRRTADQIEALRQTTLWEKIRLRTGLIPDAYFSATKIAWILEHMPEADALAKHGDLLFGTVDTWLIWNLTKGQVHATDETNASRTMLYDIHKHCWDEEIIQYFHIPSSMLPVVCPSGSLFGETATSLFGTSIPIAGVAGDQQAALFGQCCFEAGEVKNTYGTGCFLLMHTGEKAVRSESGLLTTAAARLAGEVPTYALEGSVFVAGAAVQWLRDSMRLIQNASVSEVYAQRVSSNQGMYLVPAFTGLGAPYWNPYARGMMVGITRGCEKEHFIRAALESIAYQTADVIRAMEKDSGILLTRLKVDGGASANNFLMAFQADVVDAQVLRPGCIETTALGAAYLAGLTVGFYRDKEEIQNYWALERSFGPQMPPEQRAVLLRGWAKAVKCALIWAESE